MKKNHLLKNIHLLQLDALKLSIHLDIFPNDIDTQNKFNEISQKLSALLNEYNPNDSMSLYIEDPEIWTSDPWPLNNID